MGFSNGPCKVNVKRTHSVLQLVVLVLGRSISRRFLGILDGAVTEEYLVIASMMGRSTPKIASPELGRPLSPLMLQDQPYASVCEHPSWARPHEVSSRVAS